MADQWFTRSANHVRGPFTKAMLIALKSRGLLSVTDELSTDKRSWFPAAENTELFPPPPRVAAPARAPIGEPIILTLEESESEVFDLEPERPIGRTPPLPVGAAVRRHQLGDRYRICRG